MSFEQHVEHHGQWRQSIIGRLEAAQHLMREHELLDPSLVQRMERLLQLLNEDRLVVAVVGEFSRGKSELINALLYCGKAQRVVPASVGRTTMCPVEIAHVSNAPSSLRLLPVETRQSPWTIARWRQDPSAWHTQPLDPDRPDDMVQAMRAVSEVKQVTVDEARVLGFVGADEAQAAGSAAASIEIPRWRHAVLQMEHPLLEQGLVVLDTPGLNAVGVEPELTMGLLPQAHAVLFVLGADTGVTRSDLDVWQQHLQVLVGADRSVMVVLNKIDTLCDGLAAPADWAVQIERQQTQVAQTLGVERHQVLAVSAREALVGKARNDEAMLQSSRFAELERALGQEMVHRKRSILLAQLRREMSVLFQEASRVIHARQREMIDHLLELQGLEGKNARLLQQMRWRLGQEQDGLDVCLARMQQVREQQQVRLREFFSRVGPIRLRTVMNELMTALADPGLRWDLKTIYHKAFGRLRADVEMASRELSDMHAELVGQARALNVEQGLSLLLVAPPDLNGFVRHLSQIQNSHAQYLGWSAFVQRLQSGFGVRVGHTLMSRLQSMFDTLLGDIEQWHKANLEQMESQIKGRRHHYAKRLDAMAKVQQAAGELDLRVSDLKTQHAALDALHEQLLQLQRQCLPAPLAVAIGVGVGDVVHG